MAKKNKKRTEIWVIGDEVYDKPPFEGGGDRYVLSSAAPEKVDELSLCKMVLQVARDSARANNLIKGIVDLIASYKDGIIVTKER